jgi:hypothetical protein
MEDAVGKGAMIKLVARKLDHLGSIKAHSGLVNEPSQMLKWQNQVDLAKSLVDIQEHDKKEAAKKMADESTMLVMLAGSAMEKLSQKSGDVSKITKKEICSILLACYGALVEESKHNKPALVDMLRVKIAERPENVIVSSVAAASGALPGNVAVATTIAAAQMEFYPAVAADLPLAPFLYNKTSIV